MKYDDDVKLLMEQNSPKRTIISFLLACVYGACALPAALKLRAVAEMLTVKITSGQNLEANQYGGIADAAGIAVSAAAIVIWLITFVILWHGAEKAPDMKKRLKKSAIWTISALFIYGLLLAAEALI